MKVQDLERKEIEICSVVLVYQDVYTRRHALTFSGYLNQKFGTEIGFDFACWKVAFLNDPEIAAAAGQGLANADIAVFSLHTADALSAKTKTWIQHWLMQNQDQQGLLISLLAGDVNQENGGSPNHDFLQSQASKARMGYLSTILPANGFADVGRKDGGSVRTAQFTPYMMQLFQRTEPHSDWGINE